MIKKAAAGYVGWLCANGIVAPEKNKIYAYGMELVLSGLVNVLSVLLISILIFHPADGLLFLVAFIPLRTTAGGYHANSHLSCNIVFLSTFVALECLGHLLLKYGSVILYMEPVYFSIGTPLITDGVEEYIRNRQVAVGADDISGVVSDDAFKANDFYQIGSDFGNFNGGLGGTSGIGQESFVYLY